MGTSHIVLEVKNITKAYEKGKDRETVVFEDSSFEVCYGEVVTLVGSSGCGKTTLLQACGLLDNVDSGEIFINSKRVTNSSNKERTKIRKENIGFVYQMHHLFSDFSALENVMLPLLVNGESKAIAKEKATELLEIFKLSHTINSLPLELSGGEKQRVAIARAVICRPNLILADEPTGNLDDTNAEKVLSFLFDTVKEFNLSLLMVTHNVEVANNTDRVLTIRNKKIENYYS